MANGRPPCRPGARATGRRASRGSRRGGCERSGRSGPAARRGQGARATAAWSRPVTAIQAAARGVGNDSAARPRSDARTCSGPKASRRSVGQLPGPFGRQAAPRLREKAVGAAADAAESARRVRRGRALAGRLQIRALAGARSATGRELRSTALRVTALTAGRALCAPTRAGPPNHRHKRGPSAPSLRRPCCRPRHGVSAREARVL